MIMCDITTKVCNKCGEEKPLTKKYFQQRKLKSGNLSWRGDCKDCRNKRHKELHHKKLQNIIIPDEKYCAKCDNVLAKSNFNSNKGRVDGLSVYCKKCEADLRQTDKYKEYERERTKKRSQTEQWKEYQKFYRGLVDVKDKSKQHRKQNREKYLQWTRDYHNRKKQDPLYVLEKQMRRIVWKTIKEKTKHTKEIIGCDKKQLMKHLENQFTEGMSWKNYGIDGWHIDHIIPISSAKTKEEKIKLNHYTNLQPLWAEDNLRKSNKISEEWGNVEN